MALTEIVYGVQPKYGEKFSVQLFEYYDKRKEFLLAIDRLEIFLKKGESEAAMNGSLEGGIHFIQLMRKTSEKMLEMAKKKGVDKTSIKMLAMLVKSTSQLQLNFEQTPGTYAEKIPRLRKIAHAYMRQMDKIDEWLEKEAAMGAVEMKYGIEFSEQLMKYTQQRDEAQMFIMQAGTFMRRGNEKGAKKAIRDAAYCVGQMFAAVIRMETSLVKKMKGEELEYWQGNIINLRKHLEKLSNSFVQLISVPRPTRDLVDYAVMYWENHRKQASKVEELVLQPA